MSRDAQRRGRSARLSVLMLVVVLALASGARALRGAETQLVFDQPQCAGISGFRAQWDQPIPVAEDGKRVVVDSKVKDRGQTAVWDGAAPGPLAFDAVHRSLLVRFPGAAEKIAEALAKGQTIAKVELVLPYLDEEIWPAGRIDYPSGDGYRYRMNWGCDKLYREQRPNWHAIAWALRKPWQADPAIGPTYNASINGAVYWKRFGASDTAEDRFPAQLGPVEVSSYKPDGRMDVTTVVADPAYGKALADRLRVLSDCGFVISKWEVYDARYFQGAYEWAISTGPRAILIKRPMLVVTLAPGKAESVGAVASADVRALAAQHKDRPLGTPTAVVPSAEEVARLNERFMARPEWMPEWQYQHVRQLMGLESGGQVKPFYYRVVPQHVINRAIQEAAQAATKKAGKRVQPSQAEQDYAVYLAWLDWVNGRPPRYWEGHLTAAENIMQWYNYREALPGPVQQSIIRCWTAWLMPDRETAMTDKERRDFANTSGKLIHPMADDPRVGLDAAGKQAEWNQGDTYYKLTGDWRGNKSYYRSGFTRMMSTANFNSSSSSGALLNGQIIGSENAMDDGRAGLMKFPFWMWTYNAGVGQEYIDHYYWAIATAGNKLFADFCERPEDRMAGWSIMTKTIEDLAGGYHPNLKKLIGPASRTCEVHILGQQDGLYHILHVLSPAGALSDVETGTLPALTIPTDANGRKTRPLSAWGHDYPPESVALASLSGPWADPWISELVDEKPLPWSSMVEKKVVSEGDWVTTWFGENYGLSSIRQTEQRVHVLAHWRRKPERPVTMHDVGTLDMRIGYNQTRIAEDGAGVISPQGRYRTFQHQGRVIMLARPNVAFLAQQKDVRSIQTSVALFSYEQPAPSWEVFVDGKKVEALPAAARLGQLVTVHDGVTYLAIRALPVVGAIERDAEMVLETGEPQTTAYGGTCVTPALYVHACFARRAQPFGKQEIERLANAFGGFAVTIGDVREYGDFAAFQSRAAADTLAGGMTGDGYAVTWRAGGDTFAASWPAKGDAAPAAPAFTVNGKSPYPAPERALWRDTSLTQMGKARLEKNGAVIERALSKNVMLLQTFPRHKIYVATNPVPGYQVYAFQEPGGARIIADGACSMGRWAVKDSREIDIRYHAFQGKALPREGDTPPASVLFVTGTNGKPGVTLNGKDVTATLRAWKQDGADGWLISLTGTFPKDEEIAARLKAASR